MRGLGRIALAAVVVTLSGVATAFGIFFQDDGDGGECPWWYTKPPYTCNGGNNNTECAACFRGCDSQYQTCVKVYRGAEGRLICQADRNACRGACLGEAQGCGS